jgi:hypothetical protein
MLDVNMLYMSAFRGCRIQPAREASRRRNRGTEPDRREQERLPEMVRAIAWLTAASVALPRLAEARPVVQAGLDAIGRKMDGKPAAVTTVRRKRSVFYNALEYAVELELLEYNPIDKLKVKVKTRRSKVGRGG